MHWQPNPYFGYLILSALVSAAIAAYAIWRRRAHGALGLAAVGICAAEWSLTFALYGASTDPLVRLWLIKAIHLGAGAVPVAWLVVVIVHTGEDRWLRSWPFRLVVAAAAAPLVLMLTNEQHGLFFREFGVRVVDGMVRSAIRNVPATTGATSPCCWPSPSPGWGTWCTSSGRGSSPPTQCPFSSPSRG